MAQRAGEVSVQVMRSGRGKVRIVRGVSLPSKGVTFSAHVGGRHPLLLLSPITKPDSDHLLLQTQLFSQHGYFLIVRNEYFVSKKEIFFVGKEEAFSDLFFFCVTRIVYWDL